ncbi:HAL/PAL/TAL family ammonia-lyase [Nocardia tengchongensis]|uniref:HAL/PAL/TAL family ammonia-lyase n=1 Tax=Nocardia tengchongensis TaxID=2055889 RepID=UPI003675F08A
MLAQVREITLDGHALTIEDIVTASRSPEGIAFTFSSESYARMRASHDMRRDLIESGIPIYGVTSGFGDSNTRQISKQKSVQLQDNLIRFLSAGTGPVAAAEVVRATMLVRANCLARGWSGIRPELVQLLVNCLVADILPVVPERGSVGASGDLVPLSYLAALLTGHGDVVHAGVAKSAAEALAECGLEPMALEAKEGLALVNGTSFMSGFAALALHDAAEISYVADLCTAMTSQVLLGNPDHFVPFLFAQKPHAGMITSAEVIRGVLVDVSALQVDSMSPELHFRELENPIQDRYSIRCAPHVTGVLRDTVDWARRWIEVEINSSNDNPLFDTEAAAVRHGGNFYGGHVGQAMDALKTAVASVGDLLDRQLELVVDEKFNNGLTPNLIPRLDENDARMGLFHGFKGMQIAASSLVAEALKETMPATSFSRSTEAHNQDKVSMGTIAARDARTVVQLTQRVAAIHLMALCQAADLRGTASLTAPTKAVHDLVRAVSPFVDGDRRLDTEIEAVAELVASGRVRAAAEGREF